MIGTHNEPLFIDQNPNTFEHVLEMARNPRHRIPFDIDTSFWQVPNNAQIIKFFVGNKGSTVYVNKDIINCLPKLKKLIEKLNILLLDRSNIINYIRFSLH